MNPITRCSQSFITFLPSYSLGDGPSTDLARQDVRESASNLALHEILLANLSRDECAKIPCGVDQSKSPKANARNKAKAPS